MTVTFWMHALSCPFALPCFAFSSSLPQYMLSSGDPALSTGHTLSSCFHFSPPTALHVPTLPLVYEDAASPLFENLCFEICQKERVFLNGANGCGKSSLIKAILQKTEEVEQKEGGMPLREQGSLTLASGIPAKVFQSASGKIHQYSLAVHPTYINVPV